MASLFNIKGQRETMTKNIPMSDISLANSIRWDNSKLKISFLIHETDIFLEIMKYFLAISYFKNIE